MIDPTNYEEAVTTYFRFLEDEFGFTRSDEKFRGNVFYDIQYQLGDRILSVSYENLEDYLMVTLFLLEGGRLPDYDDRTRTLHLDRLREEVFPNIGRNEILANNRHFSQFIAVDDFRRRLLKSARDLRLCLLHFGLL